MISSFLLRKQCGSTLTKLMIVIGIIGILAVVAIPAYLDYLEQEKFKRAKVGEALQLLSAMKPVIVEWHGGKGTYPTPAEIGANTNGKYSTVNPNFTEDGDRITYSAIMRDDSITGEIRLTFDYQTKTWSCNSTIEQKYLPTSCKSDKS